MSASTHFIGIGGTGLSAIARVLLERGQPVSGSDREMSPLAEALAKDGAKITIGHKAENVNGAGTVIRSSAVPDGNVEVQAALAKGIPVLKRAEMLADLLQDQNVIAVAGSHGKTTTTAMLAWIFTSLNLEPGYIIGSIASNLEENAAAGNGKYFVIEADEYDYMFLGLSPSIALITNIEHDHPDLFPTYADFKAAFKSFVAKIKPEGKLLICADDDGAREMKTHAESLGLSCLSYGLSDASFTYSAANLRSIPGKGFSFTFEFEGSQLGSVSLLIPGKHNAQNALAALAVCHMLALPIQKATKALADFSGTGRRFDVLGEFQGVVLVDDYAHHPSEIKASLSAARNSYPDRRIIACWQPHTYSRTQLLWEDFATSFGQADKVIVAPVFAARESKPAGFDLSKLVSLIDRGQAILTKSNTDAIQILEQELKNGDLLMVLSAGDAIEINISLKQKLIGKE